MQVSNISGLVVKLEAETLESGHEAAFYISWRRGSARRYKNALNSKSNLNILYFWKSNY
jgi:hypothetical protein